MFLAKHELLNCHVSPMNIIITETIVRKPDKNGKGAGAGAGDGEGEEAFA